MNDSQLTIIPLPAEISGKFCQDSVFKLGEELGRGAVSQVFKGEEWKENKKIRDVAIKVIEAKTLQGQYNIYFEKEKKVLISIINAKLNGEKSGILDVYDLIEKDQRYFLITEICKDGDLYEKYLQNENFIGIDDNSQYLNMLLDLARGIKTLHQHGIVHRDIKPENVLVTSTSERKDILKLADFGVSSCDNQVNMESKVGTVYYLAPEVILGQPYNNKVDIWGFGCLSHELKVGSPLFDGDNQIKIIQKIKNFKGKYELIDNEKRVLTQEQKEFTKQISSNVIEKCLNVIPENRPSAEEIINELEKIAKEFNYPLYDHKETSEGQRSSEEIKPQESKQEVVIPIVHSVQKEINNIFQEPDEEAPLINHEGNNEEDNTQQAKDFLEQIKNSEEMQQEKAEYYKDITDSNTTSALLLDRSKFEEFQGKRSNANYNLICFICQLVLFMKCQKLKEMKEFFSKLKQILKEQYPKDLKDQFILAAGILEGVNCYQKIDLLNKAILQLLKFSPMKKAILRASQHQELFFEIKKSQLIQLAKEIAEAYPSQSQWKNWYIAPIIGVIGLSVYLVSSLKGKLLGL